MLFLLTDIFPDDAGLRFANGKCAVSPLPSEFRHAVLFHPCGRVRLEVAQKIGQAYRRFQDDEEVNMVRDAIYFESDTAELSNGAAEILVKQRTYIAVDDLNSALRSEYDVIYEVGVCHRCFVARKAASIDFCHLFYTLTRVA